MKKILYLMRHGETLFNVQGKIQGWCDSPLTTNGIRQAKAAAAYYEREGIKFDAACCSTAERASDTLELITSLPYERLKGIREVGFGTFEGENTNIFILQENSVMQDITSNLAEKMKTRSESASSKLCLKS